MIVVYIEMKAVKGLSFPQCICMMTRKAYSVI